MLVAIGFLAMSGLASAQGAQTETSRPKPEARPQTVEKTKLRTAPEIEADIKDVKDKIAAKQKVAGYDTRAYEQKLARLEEELKKAKVQQK